MLKNKIIFALAIASISVAVWSEAPPTKIRLSGHVPNSEIAKATHVGRAPNQDMSLSVALAFRDLNGLKALVARQSDPKDAMYGKYLTPEQVLAQYGPTQSDVDLVTSQLKALGLTVTDMTGNVVHVTGDTRAIEQAFNIEIHQYKTAAGETAYAPNADPQVSSDFGGKVTFIAGLENIVKAHHHAIQLMGLKPKTGTGAQGGYAPADFIKAYGIGSAGLTGTGQTLALYELDGYTASDITQYASEYRLSTVPPLSNVLVDGFNGVPGQGAIEVTLDIELMAAVAPGATKIIVYEGPNTTQGALDTYSKMASDNAANQMSTSWGVDESTGAASLQAENTIFTQMASQGMSVFAAAGDSGAYDNGSTISVDDPASQPYVTGVGGTTLTTNGDQSYGSESSWNEPASNGQAASGGGGGISSVWPIPSYQSGFGNATNKGSTTMRMVPDVSLNANPNTGYAFVYQGQDGVVGGTSCAAPLWAAMTALINQQRATNGLAKLGFANPSLYQLGGASASYTADFHDVNDGSTNLYYPAVTGYDLSTGLGSANFAGLIAALGGKPPTTVPVAPTNLAATPHNTVVSLSWTTSPGANTYAVYRGTASGGPFTAVTTTLTAPNYVDTALTNGTAYFYYVTATDVVGTSGNSAVVSATPSLIVPEAPTNVTYTLVTQ